jgi:hypothetical protein
LLNVHNGKRDVGTARIASLAVDQGRVESTAEVININGAPKPFVEMEAHGIAGGVVER